MAKSGKDRKPRNPTPKLECPVVVDIRRPYTNESMGRIATKLAAFREAKAAWVALVRKHFKDGGTKKDVPVFDEKHFFETNAGMISRAALNKLAERYNAGEDVEIGSTYKPILVEVADEMNAQVLGISKSDQQKQPSNWDEKEYGPWHLPDEEGKLTVASGYRFTDDIRPAHATKAEDLVDDPANNILTIGSNRYVVGDGTQVRCAPLLVWGTRRGNYRAGDQARKSLSLAGNKDIVDLVYKIEDRPNEGGAVIVKGFAARVGEVAFLPGQAMTPGYLYQGDEKLTARDIRKLEKDVKGITFKSIMGQPIVGKIVPWDEIWAEIQSIEGAKGLKKMREREGRSEEDVDSTPQSKSMENNKTTLRADPVEFYPFGFRSAQIATVPFRVCDVEGNFGEGVVIGVRTNETYRVGVNDAKRALREATPKVEKVKKAKAPKAPKVAKAPKAPKVKVAKTPKAPKASKPKTSKPKTKKPKHDDAAAPVEATEPVETEATKTEPVEAEVA